MYDYIGVLDMGECTHPLVHNSMISHISTFMTKISYAIFSIII